VAVRLFGIDLKNGLRASALIACTILAACGSESPAPDLVQDDEAIEAPLTPGTDQAPLLAQSPSNAEICDEQAPISLNLRELTSRDDPLQRYFFFDDSGRMLRINQNRIIARSPDGMVQEWSLQIQNISHVQFDGHSTFFLSGTDRWAGAAVGPYVIAVSLTEDELHLTDIGQLLDAQAERCLLPTRIYFDENSDILYAYCPERISTSCHKVQHLAQWNGDAWHLIEVPSEIKSLNCAHQPFAYTDSTGDASICLYIGTQLHCRNEGQEWVTLDVPTDSFHIPQFFYVQNSGKLYAYGIIGDALLEDAVNGCGEIQELEGNSFDKTITVPDLCLENIFLDGTQSQFYLIDKSCGLFMWEGPGATPLPLSTIGSPVFMGMSAQACPAILAPDPLEPILYTATFKNPCEAVDGACLEFEDSWGLCLP